MLISVIIPACGAQQTIARAVRSLLHQTWQGWEAIVVADDGFDYRNLLHAFGIHDPRLRFVATGELRSGCHGARNVGLAAARGELIASLDADDLFYPPRLERLAPLAMIHGAALDNPVAATEEEPLYRALGDVTRPVHLTIAGFLETSIPLFPLVRRDYAEPRLAGIEHCEDVVANLRLIDRLGSLLAIPETLCEYHVVPGSMCHGAEAAATFERVYGELLDRLEHGDGLGLTAREEARAGLIRKRHLNRAFGRAQAVDPSLDFQTFVARSRSGARGRQAPPRASRRAAAATSRRSCA